MEKWREVVDIEYRALNEYSCHENVEVNCRKIEKAFWVLGIIIAKSVDVDFVRLHTFEEYHNKKEILVNENNLKRYEFDAIKEYLERRY